MHRANSKQVIETPLGWLIIIAVAAIMAFVSAVNGQAVKRVDSVGFTVSDMDKALDFYTRVLPFEKVSDEERLGDDVEKLSGVFGARVRIARLKLGDEILELTEYLTPRGRPVPIDSRSNDRWFQHIAIIVSDMDRAYAHLRTNKVRHASTGPQTLPSYITAAAGIRAFYFKDPDDHVLEILSFPTGKGLARWHELAKTGRLFLGIDHTAIVVGDTGLSTQFYSGLLGLMVAGTSDNYGPEQEHLNNVKGARLHITGLRTKEPGVAVEFLEYKTPLDGRPYPADSRANDLWHWQTTFVTGNLGSIFSSYRPIFISDGVVRVADQRSAAPRGSLIRDPDGHAVRLFEDASRNAGAGN
jgi:catechol 2,3-dioxygenase-like lactoylglutathione lyase family enzyme